MSKVFLPVGGEVDFGKSDLPIKSGLANRFRLGEITVGKRLEDLPDSQTYSRFVDFKAAAKLNLIAGTVSAGRSRKIYLHEFMRFVDIFDGDEGLRVGVSLRFVIEATVTNASVNLSGLASLAAAAELGMAETSVSYLINGISGPNVDSLHPKTGKLLSVDGYKEIEDSIDKVRSHIASGQAVLTPKILQVIASEPTEPSWQNELNDAIPYFTALSLIAAGKSQDEALLAVRSKGGTAYAESCLQDVYKELVNSETSQQRPDKTARRQAEDLLKKANVKRTGYF